MKSYIKIYGPPILKALKALEKIAADMPEVCITNSLLEAFLGSVHNTEPILTDLIMNYFGSTIQKSRWTKIISKSEEKIGDFDFYFEWIKNPNQEELSNLIDKIDKALNPLGCKYTITTK